MGMGVASRPCVGLRDQGLGITALGGLGTNTWISKIPIFGVGSFTLPFASLA